MKKISFRWLILIMALVTTANLVGLQQQAYAITLPPPGQSSYSLDFTNACDNNIGKAGEPVLCLELEKISGSSFKTRVCKGSGTFSYDHDNVLKNLTLGQTLISYVGGTGSQCDEWTTVSLSTLQCGKTSKLSMDVSSPTTCDSPACEYKTGYVNVKKLCNAPTHP